MKPKKVVRKQSLLTVEFTTEEAEVLLEKVGEERDAYSGFLYRGSLNKKGERCLRVMDTILAIVASSLSAQEKQDRDGSLATP